MATKPMIPGLLGTEDEIEKARQQALGSAALMAGLQGLVASGPSLSPVSTGQILGQAGMAGVGAYDQAMQQAQQQQMARQMQAAFAGDGSGATTDRPAMASRLRGIAAQMAGVDPQKAKLYLEMADKYDLPTEKFSGEVANAAYTLFGTADVSRLSPEQRKQANDAAVAQKLAISRAGAPVMPPVMVSYGKSFGGDLAGKQVDMLAGSYNQANSAVNTLGLVERMQPIASEAFTGPGSSVQTFLARVGEQLGVGGADRQQKLVNTASLIQDSAKMELAAAEQMKGQGQITENERQILRKAASVDVTTLTTPEINQLLEIMKKSSISRIGQHNQTLDRFIKTQPEAAQQLELYRVQPPVPVRRRQ